MESWYPVGNLCNLEGRLGGPLEVKTSNHARCSNPKIYTSNHARGSARAPIPIPSFSVVLLVALRRIEIKNLIY